MAPTPLDVARLHQATHLTHPATLRPDDEPFRGLWERGIRRSSLIPHHRLVALTLATHADPATGTIPDRHQPYLDGLTADTGLPAGQVEIALRALLDRGWIARTDPSTTRDPGTARLHLQIRALALPGLRRGH
ncbi:hypothetical protein [Streptomyces sp. NPDC047968]|uniref:hypothetical protein n=1 Tax=unclassified Streptomyces TaxID=2593676 RepID=UPI00341EFC58